MLIDHTEQLIFQVVNRTDSNWLDIVPLVLCAPNGTFPYMAFDIFPLVLSDPNGALL